MHTLITRVLTAGVRRAQSVCVVGAGHLNTALQLSCFVTGLLAELSCPKYTWHFLKKTTRAERVASGVAVGALVVCAALTVYFTLHGGDQKDEPPDVAPHEWNITRDMWLSKQRDPRWDSTAPFEPLKLVVIQHSVTSECHRFKICAAEMRNLQNYYLSKLNYDSPYNFVIGNDGRVYEGRGWGVVGAHTYGYNLCSLGIGFIGDYREEMKYHSRVTPIQVNRTMMLLNAGVQMGYLDPNYVVAGAKDLQPTESPGSNLYNELKIWKHYDGKRYAGKNCTEIQGS